MLWIMHFAGESWDGSEGMLLIHSETSPGDLVLLVPSRKAGQRQKPDLHLSILLGGETMNCATW